SEELSFSFTKFKTDQKNLILQRDALITPTGKLQLTTVENGKPAAYSLGRALYSTPIHIWDKSTGDEASFATFFSFVISDAPNPSTAATDGLAFFLAPADTQPQSAGGYLGLFEKDSSYNSSNQIVAVEFDTYYNSAWDPQTNPHIGIDVNTIKSKKVSSWGFKNGNVATVLITYQPSSKSLVASLVYPSGQTSDKTSYIISANVDLKATVPEWVRIGFSATTGQTDNYIETHDILSWSFKSKLPATKN
uniref:2-acetamido-2-deoxy-D-galactose-binding seed lectin 2 n=1 Tax=Cytisus scoparius TaxID=3835 RepID=LEC2_CYTSC|nr:RecName: Full=2-acetamido-2-deoxy-D-galactose-binding seed lectin 2; AltName: Full=2-acetamido-2-deoxy-D-galactose-binding seed lectin II; Short=CSII [Cytisus scoparius]AAB24193.1 2-acetamido-2-deoxy-D-galactose-binding lectin II, CSII [Cytisus scoparius, seeds, Peptide, 248 aa] [Cytisus scoparius]